MALTSLQVCMDSSDWLQGTIHEEAGMDSSSSPSGDMLTCPRPLMERRLRPPHDQALKCPRCDSTHTKFCYYNNYSLTQPRYFCKTCRRYWTKGGTLRNIPVGGGCRKNKKVSSKNKTNADHPHLPHLNSGSSSGAHNPTDLQLSFPAEVQLSHLTSLLGHHGSPSFMEGKYNNATMPIDFMDGSMRSHDFMGSGDQFGMIGGGFSDHHHGLMGHSNSFHNSFSNSPYGMSLDGNSGGTNVGGLGQYMDSVACQRLMLPYEVNEDQNNNSAIDVKPNTKLLSLEWQQQDQGNNCSDSYGGGLGGGNGGGGYHHHLNGLGSWSGLMNGYGASTTNPLV